MIKIRERDEDPSSADKITGIVESVSGAGKSVLIVEELVGIQIFVAQEIISPAMKVVRATLNDCIDGAPRAAPIFSLIITQQHLYFGDRVDAGSKIWAGHRAGIEAGNSVQG